MVEDRDACGKPPLERKDLLPSLLPVVQETGLSGRPTMQIPFAEQKLVAQGHIPFLGRLMPNENHGGIRLD